MSHCRIINVNIFQSVNSDNIRNTIMIYFLWLSFGLTIYYYFKIKDEPLHPDSGEFIYPGIIQRNGFKKVHLQQKIGHKYKPASLSFNSFPPYPYSSISNEKEYIGAFPSFRDKMFVWWFFEKLYKHTPLKPKNFRIINSLLIFGISTLFFLLMSRYNTLNNAILWSLIFQMTLMLPHFDFYQIHAEEWGILLLLIEFGILVVGNNSIIWAIVFGAILLFIFFFIKITFAPTLLYFFLTPLLIFDNVYFFQLSLYSIVGLFFLLLIVWVFSGKISPVLWSINPIHLIKYKKGASTSISVNQRESIFSLKTFLFKYIFEIFIIILFLMKLVEWLIFKRTVLKVEIFLVGWICVTLFEILIQGKLYPSHLLPLTVSGIFFIGLQSGYAPLFIIFSILIIWWIYFIRNKTSIMEKYGIKSQNPNVGLMMHYDDVSKIIMENSNDDETIIVFGYASPLYALSNRRGALGLYEALTTIEPNDISKKLGKYWEWWILHGIIENKPCLIIDADHVLNVQILELSLGIKLEEIETLNAFTIYKADYKNLLNHPATLGENLFKIKERRE